MTEITTAQAHVSVGHTTGWYAPRILVGIPTNDGEDAVAVLTLDNARALGRQITALVDTLDDRRQHDSQSDPQHP